MSKGLRLSKTQGASGFTGKQQTLAFLVADANQMAIGDAVILSGTANSDGVASITRANGGAGTDITGVIQGFEPDFSNLELKGRTASTARLAYIQVDPNCLYEVEIGSVLAITDVGANILLTASVPSTSGNLVVSEMVGGAVSATGPLRVVALKPDPTGALALGAVGNTAICAIVRSTLTNLTGV